MESIKCVVIGDEKVGKTSLFQTYATKQFPDYTSSIQDHAFHVDFQGKSIILQLFDSPGKECDPRLRVLQYPNTDIFLVCFSIVCPNSFTSVKEIWGPEINQHCPQTPYILVGTKRDLREETTQNLREFSKNETKQITLEEADNLARELKAVRYLECSAKTQDGLDDVFEAAMQVATGNFEKQKGNETSETRERLKQCDLI